MAKHHVTFEEAASVFLDPLEVMSPDLRHSAEEERWGTVLLFEPSALDSQPSRSAKNMKKVKASARPPVEAEEMPELDFSNGVRGKHYKQYRASIVTVQLAPDVAEHFPDSKAANEGLRELLRLRGVR